ncbi:MAG: DUF4097 family beta strand repeat-containing protein [bacterium]
MKPHVSTRFFALLLLIIPLVAGAKTRDGISKTMKKQFAIQRDATLLLNNKFGDITCINWDKNEVLIEVTITVETKSEEKAQKVFNNIEIRFQGDPNRVEARTEFTKEFNSKGPFNVDYKVWMPAWVSIDLTNNFGDVFIEDLNGKGTFRVAYGNANLENLNHGDNLVDVKFGSATIGTAKGAVITIQYSRLTLDYAGSLKIDSKFSDMQAGKVVVLDGAFEGGHIYLGQVSVMTVKTKFSNFNVEVLEEKLNLDCQYGNIEVDHVSAGFKSITVGNKFGSVELDLPPDAAYNLDAESKFGGIKFPESNAKFTYREISDQKQVFRGTVGNNPAATVTIRTEFGNITL